MGNKLSHFDEKGNAVMVDVSDKTITCRTAVATGYILVGREILEAVTAGTVKKGDVLGVARVAGIMAVKRKSELVPMCHPIMLTGVSLELSLNEEMLSVDILATTSCYGSTGVEMEALTAVTAAALTVYDMCKAVQRDMVIDDIRLLKKTGGQSGDFVRKEL